MNEPDRAIESVRQWLQTVVVGEGLCPFAARPWEEGRVCIAASDAQNDETLLADLAVSAAELLAQTPAECETTVLVLTRHLQDFLDYNDFLDLADELLIQQGWEGQLQVASFHPDYQFADVPAEDRSHWTNRAPYPLLHLLREDSVAAALAHHPDPASIPERNIRHLREMDSVQWARLFGAR